MRAGDPGYEATRLVAGLLRPRLRLHGPFSLSDELGDLSSGEPANETLSSFMWPHFEVQKNVSYEEIITDSPQDVTSLVRLLNALERTLFDALEQAEDIGFTSRPDRSDSDVPSVAAHPQNNHLRSFGPIVRVMADLWDRLAEVEPEQSRTLSTRWRQVPFLLFRRLATFAATNTVHPAADLAKAVMDLNDHDFWLTGAQVELMRGLVGRWEELTEDERAAIEARISTGLPRALFDEGSLDDRDWQSVVDGATYRRLSRLEAADKPLGAESRAVLKHVKERHPAWSPNPGDRDDFLSWSETRTGLGGDPDLLRDLPDATLVQEAMQIQRQRQFDQGDLWRLFCSSDPDRAFAGLSADADAGRWDVEAWRYFFWEAGQSAQDHLKASIADKVSVMPDVELQKLAVNVANWIEKERLFLSASHLDGQSRLWLLWDRLATLSYDRETASDPSDADLINRALNRPGGLLSSILIIELGASNPSPGGGLGDHESRFTLISTAEGEAALLGRVHFARALTYLYAIAPEWTTAHMLPRFEAGHVEVLPMWKANAQTAPGPAELFNTLKVPLRAVVLRPELRDIEAGNLLKRLLDVLIWQQLGSAHNFELTGTDVREILSVGPKRLRTHFAWLLWRLQARDGSVEDELAAKDARWRELVCPIFTETWPLDARLRTERASQMLVRMVMDTGGAFPEAVDTVIDQLGPYEINWLEHEIYPQDADGALMQQYPRPLVKLIDAIIDPQIHSIPRDLAKLLDECRQSDRQVIADSAFRRLDGFRRRLGA